MQIESFLSEEDISSSENDHSHNNIIVIKSSANCTEQEPQDKEMKSQVEERTVATAETTPSSQTHSVGNGIDMACQTPIEFMFAYMEELKAKMAQPKAEEKALEATEKPIEETKAPSRPRRAARPASKTVSRAASNSKTKDRKRVKVGRGRPKKPKATEKRWGRKEDNMLFGVIQDLEKNKTICLDNILALKEGQRLCEISDVKCLMTAVGWVSSPQKLVARVQRLCKTQSLSVREVKLLKRLAKKHIHPSGEIDFETIVYHFPGMSAAQLKEKYEEVATTTSK